MGVSPQGVRVQVLNTYHDVPQQLGFNEWHYVEVCFRQSQVTGETTLLLWVDDQPLKVLEVQDHFVEDVNYEVIVGRDFSGIIRTLSLS